MLVPIGKHYVNLGEISSIQFIISEGKVMNEIGRLEETYTTKYKFNMKNGVGILVLAEDFDTFRIAYGRMFNNVF